MGEYKEEYVFPEYLLKVRGNSAEYFTRVRILHEGKYYLPMLRMMRTFTEKEIPQEEVLLLLSHAIQETHRMMVLYKVDPELRTAKHGEPLAPLDKDQRSEKERIKNG